MRRSQLGWLMTLNGTPILWKSTVISNANCQPDLSEQLPCISVGESETYAASNGIMEFMHESYVGQEMHIPHFPSPMVILMDSTVAEAFMKNTTTKSRMKHIDVRQAWVRLVRNCSVAIPSHIDSKSNLADWFTKMLQRNHFVANRDPLLRKKLQALNAPQHL